LAHLKGSEFRMFDFGIIFASLIFNFLRIFKSEIENPTSEIKNDYPGSIKALLEP
jgi:hypothetical protein